MTEYEFEELLDRVADTMALDRLCAVDDETSFASLVRHLPPPANDNGASAWPMFAFPSGWSGSC